MIDNITIQPLKRCSKCGVEKPATVEFFQKDKNKCGLTARCKSCLSIDKHTEYVLHREAYLKRSHDWQANNREKSNAIKQKWALNHPDKERPRQRAWYQSNPEKGRENSRRYHARHPERVKEISKKYRSTHPDKMRANERKRRALKYEAGGTYTPVDIQLQYRRQKGKCYYCGCKLGSDCHIDHVIPLSRGGTNGPENLVVACPSCNYHKNNKLPHEWPEGGRLA